MQFQASRVVSLKNHPLYSEKWLQNLIVQDTALLGLGPLDVRSVERRQPRAGRLDLLLSDPDTHTRYTVELQLGATDETHIIRTIEYWDIERNRYPQFDHVAVIVAEDITSRFLNVISLFNKAIPLIAIQMNALEVGGVLTLHATKVLDLAHLGTEEEDDPGMAADRDYWINRGSAESVALADRLLELVNEVSPGMDLKFNRHYIGLARSGLTDNFVVFRPRRKHLGCAFRIPRSDVTTAFIESSGLDYMEYEERGGFYRVQLRDEDLPLRKEALLHLIRQARGAEVAEED